MPETWYTATLAVETPHGRRWRGVSFTPGGREYRVRRYANADGERLPRKAIIRYQSPLRIHANEAYETARSRTIHHNIWHNEPDPWTRSAIGRNLHGRYRCTEGPVPR